MQPNDPNQSGYPAKVRQMSSFKSMWRIPKTDFGLVGIAPSGVIDTEVHYRERAATSSGVLRSRNMAAENPRIVSDLGGDKFKMQLEVNHVGWSGVYVLVTGKGPFPPGLIGPPLGARGPDWTDKFVSMAAERGWQTDMVWFKTVDEVKE